MPDLNIFSERLKEARQKAKLTQKQLAGLSDVTAATISSYESEGGTKVPSLDKVIALAKALNVSIDWLCGLENEIKEAKDIGFDEVMNALSLILSVRGIEYSSNDDSRSALSYILINSGIMNRFLLEYQRICTFVNDTEYPQYLKDGLKKAVFEKFSQYYIENGSGLICGDEGNICDNIANGVPF